MLTNNSETSSRKQSDGDGVPTHKMVETRRRVAMVLSACWDAPERTPED
jgi:hypothetical protein